MEKGTKTRIALVQMSIADSQEANLKRAIDFIYTAAKWGAQIVAFPELMIYPYFPQEEHADARTRAQTMTGETVRRLQSAARRERVVLVCGSLYEKDGKKRYNTSVV